VRIAVIALGKIGLPLAVQFADRGHDVIGVDVDETTVASVNDGVEPFPGEDGLAAKLAAARADDRLRATTDFSDAVP
jgi:UDP-N-acetyl-D-mannosaminuronate dehydrogenase